MSNKPLQAWLARVLFVGSFPQNPCGFYARELRYPELAEIERTNRPELPPYSALAVVWDEYVRRQQPDYVGFLRRQARLRGLEVKSVLDLACGTGSQTCKLLRLTSDVVGLDASEAMLAAARERDDDRPGLTYVQGDFRNFDLQRQFDLVLCTSNSLNYVGDRDQLQQTFRAVARHLRPGGLFVFDTVIDRGSRMLSGLYLHSQIEDQRFVLHFHTDPATRRQTDRAIFQHGVEFHRRIAVDVQDVVAAVDGTGLTIVDSFSNLFLCGRLRKGMMAYFVLQRSD